MSKFRQNPITKEWTIISPGRARRPLLLGPKISRCPFCPGNEDLTGPEVYRLPPQGGRWQLRVVPNKYAITDFHEVVIHSPDHQKDLDELPLKQVERVLQAYQDRYNFYKQKSGDFYILIYNNAGKEAGASLRHPHSQLVVFEMMPEEVAREIGGVKDFYERQGGCAYCQQIRRELSNRERVVLESQFFAVLTPFASEWPYEMTIFPKIHQADFGRMSREERADLAAVIKRILQALDQLLSHPARNFWLHSLAVEDHPAADSEAASRAKVYHWHLDLIPRIKTLGGLELGAGIMVDDRVGPEEAARQLRGSNATVIGQKI